MASLWSDAQTERLRTAWTGGEPIDVVHAMFDGAFTEQQIYHRVHRLRMQRPKGFKRFMRQKANNLPADVNPRAIAKHPKLARDAFADMPPDVLARELRVQNRSVPRLVIAQSLTGCTAASCAAF